MSTDVSAATKFPDEHVVITGGFYLPKQTFSADKTAGL
jgi:hypothetical protein